MRNKKKDIDMPVGKVTEIPDFLPPPEALIMPEKKVKVTILLSERSINAFKGLARKHHTKYQKLIRNLIDKYAKEYLAH